MDKITENAKRTITGINAITFVLFIIIIILTLYWFGWKLLVVLLLMEINRTLGKIKDEQKQLLEIQKLRATNGEN